MVRAGLHRVTKPMDMVGDVVPERWSLVYFNKADRHINVGPLKEFVSPEMEPVYEDLTALEYQSMRNAVHYPEPTAGAVTVAGYCRDGWSPELWRIKLEKVCCTP